MALINFQEHAHGLTTDKMRQVNQTLQDYDRNLSLRRIPENDPAFQAGRQHNPPKLWGVYEEGIQGAATPWVFTLAEMSIDHRVLARVAMNDMTKRGVNERIAARESFRAAGELSKMKAQAEIDAERREEMMAIARLGGQRSVLRHRIGGEMKILGDEIRSPRTLISASGRSRG